MIIKKDFSIKGLNTFGIDVKVRRYAECETEAELREILRESRGAEVFVLGGGSNVLFLRDFEGYVVRPMMRGIEIESDEGEDVTVRVGAGETWDDMVKWSVERGLHGAENLSGIPGNVGASPVQNIGAYGAEAKDVIKEVEGIMIETGERFRLSAEECKFGYRDSVFKREMKGKVVITYVTYTLTHTAHFRLDYGALRAVLGNEEPTGEAIRKAVIEIRDSKLPDPRKMGNAGSFFKNPEVEKETAEALKKRYADMPTYPTATGKVKIAAGWMIDKAGWKGKTLGRAAVHDRQALVLVNRGGATGAEIVELCRAVQKDVKEMFGVEISPEVNFVG